MKNINKVIIGSMVMTSALAASYSISNAQISGTYITTQRLNMRKGPSTSYISIGILDRDYKVDVIGVSEDGQWAKIKYQNQEVFVSLQYLQKQEVEPPKDDTETDDSKEIKLNKSYKTTVGLNFRKGPSTDYSRIGYIPVGTGVVPTELSSDKTWVKIVYSGQTGWISAEYIVELNTSSEESAPNKVEIGEKYRTIVALNARKGPASTFEILTVLKKHQEVVPLELEKIGYWAKINHNGQFMYVCTTYLENIPEEAANPGGTTTPGGTTNPGQDDPAKHEKYITTAGVYMRKGPDRSYSAICVIPYQTEVEFVSQTSDGEWLKVKYKGNIGWSKSNYLQKIENSPGNTNPGGTTTPGENSGSTTNPGETTNPGQSTKVYANTTVNLNMRENAGTLYKKICVIPSGKQVEVLGYSADKVWCKVSYNGKTGWVAGEYLKLKDSTSTNQGTQVKKGITKFNLNMRKGPSTDYIVVVKIPMGSTVEIKEEANGWMKVKYKSYEGYCSAEYIENR